MACNCGADELIEKLTKQYGSKNKFEKKKGVIGNLTYYARTWYMYATMSLIIPMLVIYITYSSIFNDGKISLRNFFGPTSQYVLDYYEREQQKYQDKNQGR
jgi:hypothetical protein